MAVIPIGFAQVSAKLALTGDVEPMYCVFGIKIDVPPMTQAKADFVSSYCAGFFKPLMTNEYTYQGCTIAVGNDGGAIMFESANAAGPGTQAGATIPQNTAQLFKKSTARGGAKGRGRMFVPGIQENQVTGAGVVATAWVTAMNNEGAGLLSDLTGGGVPMVLLHSTSLDGPPDTVTSLIADGRVATQRRRLR